MTHAGVNANTEYLADHDLTVYNGDALAVLPTLGTYSVDAVVTSPPYLDARSDVEHVGPSIEVYAAWVGDWLFELERVLRPGGSMMVNVGRIHRDGVEVRLAARVAEVAAAGGWLLLDEIVWHKVNGGGGKKTPYLIDRHEYVLWLARRPDVFKGFDEARQPYAPATLERFKRRWKAGGSVVKGTGGGQPGGREPNPLGAKAGSVFTSSVGVEKGTRHPTPMPVDLAEHLVKLSCPPGGTVLDPFAGACTTAVAARRLGRRSVGIELDAKHCSECAERLAQQGLLAA